MIGRCRQGCWVKLCSIDSEMSHTNETETVHSGENRLRKRPEAQAEWGDAEVESERSRSTGGSAHSREGGSPVISSGSLMPTWIEAAMGTPATIAIPPKLDVARLLHRSGRAAVI